MIPLSVILPVYNVAPYLRACIDSILSQRENGIEIILVNDCSTDGSAGICDQYAGDHEAVTVIHFSQNRGVAAARNAGIEAARGDYLIFADSDDRLADGCLEGVRRFIAAAGGSDITICRYVSDNAVLSNDSMFDPSLHATRDPEAVIRHLVSVDYRLDHCWHYVIRRTLLDRHSIRFSDVRIYEDVEFIVRLFALADTLMLYPGNFYRYRERDGSLKNSRGVPQTAAFFKVADTLRKFMGAQGLSGGRRTFIELHVRDALGLFAARLVMHSDHEIEMLAAQLDPDSFEETARLLAGIDVAGLSHDIPTSLRHYLRAIERATLSMVDDASPRVIYLYCTGPIGEAVAKTLLHAGHPIERVLDDNDALMGRTMLEVPVETGAHLSALPDDARKAAMVVICSQKKAVVDKIHRSLTGRGLDSRQIMLRTF